MKIKKTKRDILDMKLVSMNGKMKKGMKNGKPHRKPEKRANREKFSTLIT